MHIKNVTNLITKVLIFIAILMLIPFLISVFNKEWIAAKSFAITVLLMFVSSFTVNLLTKNNVFRTFSVKDAFLFTVLTWVLATAFGALPLFISKTFSDYSSCFFEIMSGFTTTGASTLTEIEKCFKGILFWRSMTNWLGGMGIVVLFVAILPAIGADATTFHLMGTESVGPIKGKLTPKTRTTAILLWSIYLGFTLLEIICLLCGGLSLFDAVTVSFSTLSAAGFCVKNASIGSFNSAYIEVIVTFFMIISGLNFAIYYKIFTGKIREAFKDTEMRWYLFIIVIASVCGAVFLVSRGYYETFSLALRKMSFHIISVLTTTGFATSDYNLWPSFPVLLIVLVSFIGGCAGSAGGGIKVSRISVICKSGLKTIRKKIHPASVMQIRDNNGVIENEVVNSIFTFTCVYIITWLLGSVIISLSGQDILTCLSSCLLTLGNIGIGFGKVGPAGNFSIFPLWSKWIFSFLMLVGRLELFTVYVLFSHTFWKN